MNTTTSRGLVRLVAGPVAAASIIGGALGLASVASASTTPGLNPHTNSGATHSRDIGNTQGGTQASGAGNTQGGTQRGETGNAGGLMQATNAGGLMQATNAGGLMQATTPKA